MWSNENKRFTMLCILVVAIAVTTIAAIVVLVNRDHTKDTVLVTGFVGILLAQIFSMLRAEQERIKSQVERTEIKEAAKQTKEMVLSAVQSAADTPAAEQKTMPSTPEELSLLVREIVHRFVDTECASMVQRAAEAAAKEAARITAEIAANEVAKHITEIDRLKKEVDRGKDI